ncbi:MAG: isochorismatase family protein [Alphaproteobacteria bacterium]|nr:isochorismatase family protein [Alphaproteobacteria bacterium]
MVDAAKARQRSLGEKSDPAHTALLVVDMQNDFCHPDGFYGRRGMDVAAMPTLAARVQALVDEARRLGILILWIRAHYDDLALGAPMAEVLNRPGRTSGSCLAGSFGADWFGSLRPREGANEAVVTKHRYSAFWDSAVDLYLRSNAIQTVVLCGVSTDVCVESTARDAFFRNYFIVTAADASSSRPEFHRTALDALARAFGVVHTTDELLASWRGADAAGGRGWHAVTKDREAAWPFDTLVTPGHTALVIVDMQNDFCHPHGVMGEAGEDLSEFPAAIAAQASLLAAARQCGAMVVHVQGSNLPVARPRSARGLVSEREKVVRLTQPGTWGAQNADALAPLPHEPVVLKHRYSAFVDTRLETLLRSNGMRTLVVTGTATQTCVESTVRDGQMRDYRIVVPADAVASRGRHRHLKAASLETMGLYFADIIASESVAAVWQSHRKNRSTP